MHVSASEGVAIALDLSFDRAVASRECRARARSGATRHLFAPRGERASGRDERRDRSLAKILNPSSTVKICRRQTDCPPIKRFFSVTLDPFAPRPPPLAYRRPLPPRLTRVRVARFAHRCDACASCLHIIKEARGETRLDELPSFYSSARVEAMYLIRKRKKPSGDEFNRSGDPSAPLTRRRRRGRRSRRRRAR